MRTLPRWALKEARALLVTLSDRGGYQTEATDVVAEIDRCLSPSSSTKSRRAAKATKRAAKNKETSDIYAAVSARAGNECECGCGWHFGLGINAVPQMDHVFGRKHGQSAEECWLIRSDDHRDKTLNSPDAAFWMERIRAWAIRHSYWATAAKAGKRIEYLRAKAALSKRVAP